MLTKAQITPGGKKGKRDQSLFSTIKKKVVRKTNKISTLKNKEHEKTRTSVEKETKNQRAKKMTRYMKKI